MDTKDRQEHKRTVELHTSKRKGLHKGIVGSTRNNRGTQRSALLSSSYHNRALHLTPDR